MYAWTCSAIAIAKYYHYYCYYYLLLIIPNSVLIVEEKSRAHTKMLPLCGYVVASWAARPLHQQQCFHSTQRVARVELINELKRPHLNSLVVSIRARTAIVSVPLPLLLRSAIYSLPQVQCWRWYRQTTSCETQFDRIIVSPWCVRAVVNLGISACAIL